MFDKTEQEIMQDWKGDISKPLVSICCITYMHENYISQALDSFLMQETTFPFEIIVRDDCSTDNNPKIIKDYKSKYPNIIKPILEPKNMFSKGIRPTPIVLKKALGDYIAVCEGDDYWTDNQKLQIQVNFLEKHENYNGAFHDSLNMYDDSNKNCLRIGDREIDEDVDIYSLINENNIATASLVYRNNLGEFPEYFYNTKKGDYALAIRISEFGKLKYIPKAMSIYRIHEGGIWSLKKQEFHELEALKFFNLVSEYFDDKKITNTVNIKLKLIYFNLVLVYLREKKRTLAMNYFFKMIFSKGRKHKYMKYKKILKEFIKSFIK